MDLFSCSACGQTVFFENSQCTQCGALLAYLPDRQRLSAVEALPGERVGTRHALYQALDPDAKRARYRMCENGGEHAVCNWCVPAEDPEPLCCACRLNDVIPDLSKPGARDAWHRMEIAKRRLLHTLLGLGLPVESRAVAPKSGLEFCFMADQPEHKVFTGHCDGLITINLAEADDPFREKIRAQLGETYRTLLGHFRHEIGHYYWDRLVKDSAWLTPFRALFGDETADYAEAVKRHYAQGAPADWPQRYVSAYATMHPWEDWAESWAHYLHMVDTLDTARAHGLTIRERTRGLKRLSVITTSRLSMGNFDDLLAAWIPVTVALNSLNRSMGRPDAYPFVLTRLAVKKLRFVHDVIEHVNASEKRVAKAAAAWSADAGRRAHGGVERSA